ncbi:hypothetical protein SGRIM119S_08481 [Streptomyces griseorubiginosus]
MLPGPVTMSAGGQDRCHTRTSRRRSRHRRRRPRRRRAARRRRRSWGRQAVELGLRRGGEGDRADAGSARAPRSPPRRTGTRTGRPARQPDPVYRHPLLGRAATGHDLVDGWSGAARGDDGRGGWTPPGPRARPGPALRAPCRAPPRAPAPGSGAPRPTSRRSRSAPRHPDDARPRLSDAPSPGRPRRRSRLGAAGRAGRGPRGGRRRADRFGRSRTDSLRPASAAVRAFQWRYGPSQEPGTSLHV